MSSTMQVENLARDGQNPFCVLLTCSDSRIPIEMVFDRGMGSLFVIRTFGNIVDDLATASIEYALESFGIQLLVVMGHSRMGAIRLTMESEDSDYENLTPSLRAATTKIGPSLRRARIKHHYFDKLDRSNEKKEIFEKILQTTCSENIETSIKELQNSSKLLSRLVSQEKLFIVPANYEVQNGRVNFSVPKKLAPDLTSEFMETERLNHGKSPFEVFKQSLNGKRKKRSA